MSVSLWSYREGICDGGGCVGDCDLCDKPKNIEEEDEGRTEERRHGQVS